MQTSFEGGQVVLTGTTAGSFPTEPAEGQVAQGETAGAQKVIWQYKSNSNEATPFSIALAGPFSELPIKSLPVVQFFNGRETVAALTIKATWKLGTEPEKLVIEFPSHVPAPLKKGEVLTIVTIF